MRVFLKLVRFLAGQKGLVSLSVLLGTATVGSGIALMATSAYLISRAALQPSIAELQVAIVGVRFFGLSRGIFRYLERLVSHSVSLRVLARMRVWFYEGLEPLVPAGLEEYQSGDLMSRIVGDIETLEDFYVRAIAPPLVALLVGIGMALFMGQFDWRLALVLVFFLGLAGLLAPLLVGRISRGPGEREVAQRARLSSELVGAIQGLPDILACGAEGRMAAELEVQGQLYGEAQRKMVAMDGFQGALHSLLANLGAWAVLFLGSWLVVQGQLEGVLLAVVVLAAIASFEAVAPLPQAGRELAGSQAAARRLFALEETEPVIHDPPDPLELPTGRTQGLGLEACRLSFRYRPTGTMVLRDIQFNLAAGGRMALVGPTGAGKSSLANLLLRFWDPSEGSLRVNGTDLREVRQEAVRNSMAVVAQDTFLFHATLRDNLRIANPEATEGEIQEAARQAQLHEFILNLPQGYGTRIGEQGFKLSGGQRQRLAVARALLRQAPLLVLDEATANLDPLTEAALLGAILDHTAGRTLLMITHRLVAMEHMDLILVLDQGQVVERGAHTDLVEAGGLYARLWELQNQVLAV